MIFDLTGRVALVTGAGQNVGAGIARMLAAQGATVAVNDVDPTRALEVAEAIRAEGGAAVIAPFDVTDHEAVRAGVADAVERAGPIGILVNNAGNGGQERITIAPFRDTEPAAWEGAIRVNLYGVLHCCREVVGGMCDRGWGRVITISSVAGTGGAGMGIAAYSAGKGGGLALTRTLALEVAPSGVTANTVALGLMSMSRGADTPAEFGAGIPVGRMGNPEDVGAACVWLASNEASWVTGQTIQVNGGSLTS